MYSIDNSCVTKEALYQHLVIDVVESHGQVKHYERKNMYAACPWVWHVGYHSAL